MITLREYNSFTDLEHIKEEWDKLVLECNSTIYMTFDWCKIWWKFYGSKNELLIFHFYDDDKIIGILPVYFEKIFFGPVSLKVCRLIGSNIPPKIFNPPVSATHKIQVLEHFLKIISNKCDIVSIGPVSENYLSDEDQKKLNDKSLFSHCSKEFYDDHMFIKLPDNFNKYLESISSREKSAYKKNIKRLNRDFKLDVDIIKSFDEMAFKTFQGMHYNQWIKKGMLGHFKSWPFSTDFHLALAQKQAEFARYLLIKISKNQEAIFIGYGYIFNNTFYFQLFARSVSPEDEKYSIGTIGHCIIAEFLINNKGKMIELGPGLFDYKINLGAKSEKAWVYKFIANRKSSLFKHKIVMLEKKFVNIIYHKFWYRRVQPLLPAFLKQPLSKHWVRLDF